MGIQQMYPGGGERCQSGLLFSSCPIVLLGLLGTSINQHILDLAALLGA